MYQRSYHLTFETGSTCTELAKKRAQCRDVQHLVKSSLFTTAVEAASQTIYHDFFTITVFRLTTELCLTT
jgi:hypothetical protein